MTLENGSDICSCKKVKCVRHGNCVECLEYHNKSKSRPIPYCKRSKKSVIQRFSGKNKQ